jgi:hypothetical protein
MPDQIITADANWLVVGPLYLHPASDDTALLRQALEALKEARAVDCGCPWLDHWNDAITALRERLKEGA